MHPVPGPLVASSIAGLTDISAVWLAVAAAGWLVALLLVSVAVRRRSLRRRAGSPVADPAFGAGPLSSRDPMDPTGPGPDPAGVLRWLLRETEADAAAYLELVPGGERLLIEPRGLDNAVVADLAALARRALVSPEAVRERAGAVARWLGARGSTCIVLLGPSLAAEEPLRFSRYAIEWGHAARGDRRSASEERVADLLGIAWAEERGPELWLLVAEGADRAEVASEVHRILAGAAVHLRWIEAVESIERLTPRPAGTEPEAGAAGRPFEEPGVEEPGIEVRTAATQPPAPEPPAEPAPAGARPRGLSSPGARIHLLDLVLGDNGDATADVRVGWRDHELRGRGHGPRTEGGRHYAAAFAVADALRPLLDTDVLVDGLYTATTREGAEVLIAEVLLEGQRLIGAVLLREDHPELTGARAVLDAVNRRLSQVAGRSGRI